MILPVQFNPYPGNCWPASPNDFLGQLRAVVDTLREDVQGLIIGDLPPSNPDDRSKLWLRLNMVNPELNGVYKYDGSANGVGGWVKPVYVHPNVRLIYTGTEADLAFFDGGDNNPPGDWSGPMWEIDSTFEFRFPLGAGTNSVSYNGNPATSVAVGQVGGAEKVALKPEEGGGVEHRHVFGRQEDSSGQDRNDVVLVKGSQTGAGKGVYVNGQGPGINDLEIKDLKGSWLVTLGVATETETTKAHENMPPWRAVYFIRRTTRKGHYIAG